MRFIEWTRRYLRRDLTKLIGIAQQKTGPVAGVREQVEHLEKLVQFLRHRGSHASYIIPWVQAISGGGPCQDAARTNRTRTRDGMEHDAAARLMDGQEHQPLRSKRPHWHLSRGRWNPAA